MQGMYKWATVLAISNARVGFLSLVQSINLSTLYMLCAFLNLVLLQAIYSNTVSDLAFHQFRIRLL